MGEIADMMLDGTMDPETGEFNFNGADGPGWPMSRAEAAEWKRQSPPKVQAKGHQRDLAAITEALSIAAGWARNKPDSQRARDKVKAGLDAARRLRAALKREPS